MFNYLFNNWKGGMPKMMIPNVRETYYSTEETKAVECLQEDWQYVIRLKIKLT